ncbi:ABC transporter ATP-binding protein [Devosia rhizoryzae]|uniref:Sn-glycerol-3-phosphate ABC transporter ATP-binding protein UgpC n=1 Tax=Devosia rhizoryzae TaxID=2774137 RepID=A0ABX7C984_9HYPH|nr:sn-glycerol-3-phosphate ABC transporter ATP-binding protein UgpC [Devosia rhizoryzae]QQR39267.1 sn-glycerol-3-phosphate ABC transporter ATP-binding protein UgpC [Devosia rhizoryzae]
MAGVTIDKVRRSYGALTVLKDVSLDVQPGEFAVLLGPSGCGKSTLLASIAGLDDLQSGRILFDGEDVTDYEPAERNIGMVFQSYALYPNMTVRQNMSFGLEVAKTPKAEIVERVQWAAQLLQIEPLLDRKPSQLSGGQRQRIAIGRALVRKADLFLFDEPLSNLDAKLRTEMRVEIKNLHQKLGVTFIYVTHDQVEAMTLATRIAVMHGGVIEQYASPDEVYNRPASLFVADFVGSPPMNLLPARLQKTAAGLTATIEGHTVPVDNYPFLASPADGEEIVLGIRPEHVLIDAPDAAFAIRAPILVVEPLGADTLAWFELANKRMAARLTPEAARGLGREVSLSFDLRQISLFSKATERRL